MVHCEVTITDRPRSIRVPRRRASFWGGEGSVRGGYQQSAIYRVQRGYSKSEVKRSSRRDGLRSLHDTATDVTVSRFFENDLRPCIVCVILFICLWYDDAVRASAYICRVL